MTSELQTPKEWFKVKSESETVPEEREWPFGSSSLEKLSQRLAEKAHLLTKTRKTARKNILKHQIISAGNRWLLWPAKHVQGHRNPHLCLGRQLMPVLMQGKKNCPCSSSWLSVLSRWEMFFWASLLLTGWPLPTALEPNPSSFIRGTIGSQLSGDGDTLQS